MYISLKSKHHSRNQEVHTKKNDMQEVTTCTHVFNIELKNAKLNDRENVQVTKKRN